MYALSIVSISEQLILHEGVVEPLTRGGLCASRHPHLRQARADSLPTIESDQTVESPRDLLELSDAGPVEQRFDLNPIPARVAEITAKGLSGRVTTPRVLEYKFSLDGLIEDFDSQDKNIKDVDLCVARETGDLYKEKYSIVPLLIPENSDQRQYHGVTHYLADLENGAKQCDLIILGELIDFLNNGEASTENQRIIYE